MYRLCTRDSTDDDRFRLFDLLYNHLFWYKVDPLSTEENPTGSGWMESSGKDCRSTSRVFFEYLYPHKWTNHRRKIIRKRTTCFCHCHYEWCYSFQYSRGTYRSEKGAISSPTLDREFFLRTATCEGRRDTLISGSPLFPLSDIRPGWSCWQDMYRTPLRIFPHRNRTLPR